MAILSFAEIMEADDITEQELPIPEWGGSVVVRSLSHRTMQKIRNEVSEKAGDGEPDEGEIEKWILIKGLVQPQITEEEYEHLMDKSYSAVMKIQTAILGRSKTKETAAKEEEKNFPSESE